MSTKPLQLTVAILAGTLLGGFATHFFLNRPPAHREEQRAKVGGQKSDELTPQPKTESAAPIPPLAHSPTPPPSAASRAHAAITSSVPATLSITAFTETRSQISSSSATLPQTSGLRLELLFSGEAVNRALKYGNLQITKAVDDAGNDLIIRRAERPGGFVTNSLPVLRPIEPPNPQGRMPAPPFLFPRPSGTKTGSTPSAKPDGGIGVPPVKSTPKDSTADSTDSADKKESVPSVSSVVKDNPSSAPKTEPPKPSASPQTVRLSIHLKSPPRSSTALKELEGTLQLLQTSGTLEIKTPAVKTLEGKSIETAELQSARVSIGIQPPPKSSFVTDAARAVTLRISGTKDAILRVAFVDKENKPLCTSNSWYSPAAGVEDWTYVFEKPVGEEVTLQLTLVKDAKLETIPFRIQNLQLP